MRRAIKYLDPKHQADRLASMQQRLFDLDLQTLHRRDWQGFDRRAVFINIQTDIGTWPDERRKALIAELTKTPGDPWLTRMASAESHMRLAWSVRGGGYADTVTPGGWQGLAGEMHLAEAGYKSAYAANPENPEAAVGMLQVVQGLSGGAEQLREWFDRATDAQN